MEIKCPHFSVEEALALPWTSYGPKTNFVEFKTIKADYIAVKKANPSLQESIKKSLSQKNRGIEEYRFRCTIRSSKDLLLPTFTLVEKPDLQSKASARLLTTLQASVQHHRHCLRLTRRPVFGATMVGTKLTLFSTYWASHKRLVSLPLTARICSSDSILGDDRHWIRLGPF